MGNNILTWLVSRQNPPLLGHIIDHNKIQIFSAFLFGIDIKSSVSAAIYQMWSFSSFLIPQGYPLFLSRDRLYPNDSFLFFSGDHRWTVIGYGCRLDHNEHPSRWSKTAFLISLRSVQIYLYISTRDRKRGRTEIRMTSPLFVGQFGKAYPIFPEEWLWWSAPDR